MKEPCMQTRMLLPPSTNLAAEFEAVHSQHALFPSGIARTFVPWVSGEKM